MTTASPTNMRSSRTPGVYKRKEVPRFSLQDTPIFERYITSSADKKRELKFKLIDQSEVSGYALGLDDDWVQILVLETKEQEMIFIHNIVKITHGRTFYDLEDRDKETVENFTSAFRSASVAFLKRAWPQPGDSSEDDDATSERSR